MTIKTVLEIINHLTMNGSLSGGSTNLVQLGARDQHILHSLAEHCHGSNDTHGSKRLMIRSFIILPWRDRLIQGRLLVACSPLPQLSV